MPSLVLPLAFRPPISLYISRISIFPGRDSSASALHFSSLASFGVWYPDIRGLEYPDLREVKFLGPTAVSRVHIDCRYVVR